MATRGDAPAHYPRNKRKVRRDGEADDAPAMRGCIDRRDTGQKRLLNANRKRHPRMLSLFARLPWWCRLRVLPERTNKNPAAGGAVGALHRSAQLAAGEAEASEDKTYKCEGAGFWDGSGFPI